MAWRFSKIQLKEGCVLAFQGDSAPFLKARITI